jgi:hypothetical protein
MVKNSRGDKTDKSRNFYNPHNETTTERNEMNVIARTRQALRQRAYSRAWERKDWEKVLAPYTLKK